MKKFLIIIISLYSALFLVSCNNTNVNSEATIIAKINGKEISLEEYEKNIVLFGGQYESVFGKDVWNQEIGDGITYRESFKKELFDRMITQELILQVAEKNGIEISDDEINNELASFREKNENNTEFQTVLMENNIDDNFLKKQFKYELYLEKYKTYITKNNKINEESIENYYNSNTAKFTDDEVKASHILFKTIDDNFKTLSDSEIENKFVIAETVLKKIEQGESFEEMAIKYSEDKATSINGGDLGYFKAGEMVDEFDETAFALKVGEVSKIIKTIHGYHIIKVYDKIRETLPLESVKEGIVAKLEMDLFDSKVKALYNNAEVEEFRDLIKSAGDEK
ncbi:MAG: peptidylprolyl isomerase [Filifactoraceae bacterium]